MGKWRQEKTCSLRGKSSIHGNRDEFPPPSPSFTGWEEGFVTSNQTKILNIDLEELLREDSDNEKESFILSDPSLRTQPNVHDSSKENNTEKKVDDSDKKVEPTTIVKKSDGTYKIKPQEVPREEESENDEASFSMSSVIQRVSPCLWSCQKIQKKQVARQEMKVWILMDLQLKDLGQ